jgi:DnaD/phage-associated family protein
VDKARSQMIRAVSDRFFSGQMPNSWYGEIDLWISKYGFSPEVVFMLFQHCAQNNAVTKPYMRKVAESWGEQHHIRTAEQLEEYFRSYEEFDRIRKEIRKRLHIQVPLTDYQSEYVQRWFYTYGYNMEIIALALKEGAGFARPTFNLYEKILKDWYDRGLRTVQDIKAHLSNRGKKSGDNTNSGSTNTTQKTNYSQRQYSQDFFDSLYKESDPK